MNRKELVLQALRSNHRTRNDQKMLVLQVWRFELEDRPFTPENIELYCSNPAGILRDRRRVDVLEKFPRDEKKYEHFKSFTNEFSQGSFW